MPNYCDPNLIMDDPYWYFHITRADIEAARPYPRMWSDILAYIDNQVETFDFYFTADPKMKRAQLFRKASQELHRVQDEIHMLLHTPNTSDRLTASEVDELTALTKMTLEEFLPTTPPEEPKTIVIDGKTFPDISDGMTIDYSPLVHERIVIEQRYEQLTRRLQDLNKRPKLTKVHKRLLRQARERINTLYKCRIAPISLLSRASERS